jgi:hypothetical protein
MQSTERVGAAATAQGSAPPRNGGCNFFENPDIDSRHATPVWVRVPPSVAELATEEISTRSSAFSIWLARASRSMVHDGRLIQVRIERGCRSTELTIPPELEDGLPFSFRVTPGRFHRLNWLAAQRVNEILTASRPTAVTGTAFRPTRTAVTHMRMIQILDGRAAGASHRDIATAVFGDQVVRRSWSADGELRAQVRYLVRRSAKLASNGYRHLAGLEDEAPGDFATVPDSP